MTPQVPEAAREAPWGWDGMGWEGAALSISLWCLFLGKWVRNQQVLPSWQFWEGGKEGRACPDPLLDTDFEAGMSDPAGIQFLSIQPSG